LFHNKKATEGAPLCRGKDMNDAVIYTKNGKSHSKDPELGVLI